MATTTFVNNLCTSARFLPEVTILAVYWRQERECSSGPWTVGTAFGKGSYWGLQYSPARYVDGRSRSTGGVAPLSLHCWFLESNQSKNSERAQHTRINLWWHETLGSAGGLFIVYVIFHWFYNYMCGQVVTEKENLELLLNSQGEGGNSHIFPI